MRVQISFSFALLMTALTSCSDGPDVVVVNRDTDTVSRSATDTGSNLTDTSQRPTDTTMQVVVNISTKELSVLRNGDTIQQYPIAVGTEKNPTPTGDFTIHQIDFNPDWTPPNSDWAKDRSYKEPGAPGNPMGNARIIYQMPYTIHGTDNLNSLGEAESHGSIRVANKNVMELARLLMQVAGNQQPESWYQQVQNDSTKMVQVQLNKRIPLRNIKP